MFKYMTNPTEIDKHCNGMHILSSKKNINLSMKTVCHGWSRCNSRCLVSGLDTVSEYVNKSEQMLYHCVRAWKIVSPLPIVGWKDFWGKRGHFFSSEFSL